MRAEGLGDHRAHAHDRSPGLFQQADAAKGRLAVGEEIVDEQYAVAGVDELRFERELVAGVLGEGKDLRLDDALLQDAGLGLLRMTIGTSSACAVITAGAMPEASMVATRVMPSSANRRANSAPTSRIRSTSTWWFKKESTSKTSSEQGRHPRAVSVPPAAAFVSRPFPFFPSILPHLRAFCKARGEKRPPRDVAGRARYAAFTARGRRRWRTRRRRCPVRSPRVRIWRSARG